MALAALQQLFVPMCSVGTDGLLRCCAFLLLPLNAVHLSWYWVVCCEFLGGSLMLPGLFVWHWSYILQQTGST